MTLSYDQLMKWRPEQGDAAGDRLNNIRKKLADQQGEMDVARMPDSWEGASAESAHQRFRNLRDSFNDIVSPVAKVRDAVDEFAGEVKAAKKSAESAHGAILGKGYKISTATSDLVLTEAPPAPKGEMTEAEAKEAEAKAEADKAAVQEFQRQLLDALRKAEQADLTLNSVLSMATSNRYDGGEGSIQQASLPPELRGLSDKEIATRMVENPDQYGGYVDNLTQSQKQAVGVAMADAMDPITDPNHPGLWTEDGRKIDPAKIAEFNSLFEAFGKDHVISTSFLNDVGPEGLLNLNGYIARLQSDDNFMKDDANPYHDTIDPALTRQIGLLQQNLGQTLDAGTEGVNSADTGGSANHVSGEWIAQLVAKGDDTIPVGYQGQDGDAPYKAYGYQLMGPLLRHTDNGYLLNEVGDGMLDFETRFAKENGGATPWGLPLMDDDGRIVGGYTDRFASGGPSESYMEGIRLDWTGGSDSNAPAGFDPMGALLDGMSNNPDAARDFFDGPDVHASDGEGTRRIDYLLTDRTWPHDEVAWQDRPIDKQTEHGPTNSGALGDALKAATMDTSIDATGATPAERDAFAEERKKVGRLLDDIVTSTAQDNELVQDGEKKTEAPADVDAIRPELRDDLGEIFGHHAETMHESMAGTRRNEDGSDAFGPYSTTFDEGSMRRFLFDIGKDPEAYQTLRQAEYAQVVGELEADLKGPPHNPDYIISSHLGGMSDVFGALDYGADKGQILDTLTEDTKHNEEVGKKAGIAREIAGLIPMDAAGKVVPGAGWALDHGVNSAIDSWEKANLHDRSGAEEYNIDSLQDKRQQMAEDVIAEMLAKKGYALEVQQGLGEEVEDAYTVGYQEAKKYGETT